MLRMKYRDYMDSLLKTASLYNLPVRNVTSIIKQAEQEEYEPPEIEEPEPPKSLLDTQRVSKKRSTVPDYEQQNKTKQRDGGYGTVKDKIDSNLGNINVKYKS